MMGHTVVYDGSYGAVWPCDLNHFWFFFKDFKDLYRVFELLDEVERGIVRILFTLSTLRIPHTHTHTYSHNAAAGPLVKRQNQLHSSGAYTTRI